jgi:hypothetical protein
MKKPIKALACAWLAWGLLCVGLALVPDSVLFVIALFAGIPILGAWLGLSIWSMSAMIRSLAQQRWLAAATCLTVPFAVPVGVYRAIPFVQYPGERAHFLAARSEYDATVARLPRTGQRFREFVWGGMLFASTGVVYDETDEVGLPYGHQSAQWKRRMRNTDLTCGGDGPIGWVMPMGDHHYVVSLGC